MLLTPLLPHGAAEVNFNLRNPLNMTVLQNMIRLWKVMLKLTLINPRLIIPRINYVVHFQIWTCISKTKSNQKLITCKATHVSCQFSWLYQADFRLKKKMSLLKKTHTHTHANSFNNWLCLSFSGCPQNLTCPRLGGGGGCSRNSPCNQAHRLSFLK